ncbi:hypothetical protein [Arcobacter sp. CECT 8986]|nr:hypothetical protein [Arcobacter sp. CECT 8986]
MNYEFINLIIALIALFNTLVFIPVFKFCFYAVKEINYIKGQLDLDN